MDSLTMGDHLGSHHTQHAPPYQNECSHKTFLQIILAAKWFVQHSSTSPNNSDGLCLLFCPYPSSMVQTKG